MVCCDSPEIEDDETEGQVCVNCGTVLASSSYFTSEVVYGGQKILRPAAASLHEKTIHRRQTYFSLLEMCCRRLAKAAGFGECGLEAFSILREYITSKTRRIQRHTVTCFIAAAVHIAALSMEQFAPLDELAYLIRKPVCSIARRIPQLATGPLRFPDLLTATIQQLEAYYYRSLGHDDADVHVNDICRALRLDEDRTDTLFESESMLDYMLNSTEDATTEGSPSPHPNVEESVCCDSTELKAEEDGKELSLFDVDLLSTAAQTPEEQWTFEPSCTASPSQEAAFLEDEMFVDFLNEKMNIKVRELQVKPAEAHKEMVVDFLRRTFEIAPCWIQTLPEDRKCRFQAFLEKDRRLLAEVICRVSLNLYPCRRVTGPSRTLIEDSRLLSLEEAMDASNTFPPTTAGAVVCKPFGEIGPLKSVLVNQILSLLMACQGLHIRRGINGEELISRLVAFSRERTRVSSRCLLKKRRIRNRVPWQLELGLRIATEGNPRCVAWVDSALASEVSCRSVNWRGKSEGLYCPIGGRAFGSPAVATFSVTDLNQINAPRKHQKLS